MNDKQPTTAAPRGGQLVTADEWFAGGRRVGYDPSARHVAPASHPGSADAAARNAVQVFERIAAPAGGTALDAVWLTMLPGFPDGSYGWAQVDRLLGDEPTPRLYVEPVGQGDSDKPRDYPYSTMERADLVQALWRHHDVRHTVVVTFDYTSLAVLELLRRQLDEPAGAAGTRITAVFMINGGLFADRHSHPWLGTPLLRSRIGALGMRQWQASLRPFEVSMRRAQMYSRDYRPESEEIAQMWSAITRRDGAAFAHNAAGFLREHKRHAERWDLAAIDRELDGSVALYVGGSEEDAYEHRQLPATRIRAPRVEVRTFPGGHLTTSEHPDLLATEIRRIAARHGVGAATTSTRSE
ncbi:alpha/beta fold hydrolase [Microlunatus sp. Gsoil 973]|uniref:alpha/beta fold hydrolase n=1 Tax=Microlunatus sp. Gsoil 973 TaxID=2672569 RepID=UPI0012B44D3B|nr:alpha/beta hydrolase [Microlunatus sp. Gsoil 973]QGN31610.1 alpha/beta hydrolase [Microlunatus sp. Gsoil 973]